VADDRTYATWKAVVDTRLTALGTEVLYLGVSYQIGNSVR
jgi:hypothetical protein